jgi:hypothetical protein
MLSSTLDTSAVDNCIPKYIATITDQFYLALPQKSDPDHLVPRKLAAPVAPSAAATTAGSATVPVNPTATIVPISTSKRKAISTAGSATSPSRFNFIGGFNFLKQSDLFQTTFAIAPQVFTCPNGQAFSSTNTQSYGLNGFAHQIRPLIWAVFKLLVWRD